MEHSQNCRWLRTKPDDCAYRETHEYCPHPEHECDCERSILETKTDSRLTLAVADAAFWFLRYQNFKAAIGSVLAHPLGWRDDLEIIQKIFVRQEHEDELVASPSQRNLNQ